MDFLYQLWCSFVGFFLAQITFYFIKGIFNSYKKRRCRVKANQSTDEHKGCEPHNISKEQRIYNERNSEN